MGKKLGNLNMFARYVEKTHRFSHRLTMFHVERIVKFIEALRGSDIGIAAHAYPVRRPVAGVALIV